MAYVRESQIDYFAAATNWTDRQAIINFLNLYDWELEFAIDGFWMHFGLKSEETRSNMELAKNNSIEQLTVNESHATQQEQLYNSLSYSQSTTDNLNTSDRTSFLEHVDQSQDATASMFPDIYRLLNNREQLLQYMDSDVIGKNKTINTPWGTRPMIYADYTASGRGLKCIEHYMLNNVLPYYGNTHSENNVCAQQTTGFREGARQIIKKCVNATDDDVVIFTGSGSTAAIHKLVNVLHLKDEKIRKNIVVFISTFEHHSNILPWKETGVEVIRIPNDKQGLLDQEKLVEQLKYYHNHVQKHIICTFNAASNVTGIRTDVDSISRHVHQYNGWICWDYAAAAPYVKIDMNSSEMAYKDAIFISTHKFIGGPSTPGILIAKKKLFTNKVPCQSGGGTVNYVTRTHVEYVQDIQTREEGGTPDILGSIRAGLVFQLKEAVGPQLIELLEDELVEKVLKRFQNHKTLFLLGSTKVPRLAIFSFLIYVESIKKYLHHHFICILLNDLFGIQVRSGCSCAGPYVLDLLHIDDEKAEIYTKFITENKSHRSDLISRNALMKPGFARFNLPYFASHEEVDYILNALDFIANNGYMFFTIGNIRIDKQKLILSFQYTYDLTTASWHPRDTSTKIHLSQLHSLGMITFENGVMQENVRTQPNQLINSTMSQLTTTTTTSSFSNDPIQQAELMVGNIPKYVSEHVDFRTDPPLNIPNEYQSYIWFATPKQIIIKMLYEFEQNQEHNRISIPFRPRHNNQETTEY